MATPLEIPLISRPETFAIQLGAVTYNLRVYWLVSASCWAIDIADQNLVPLVNGLPLVTGTDLLGQFAYLIPGTLQIVNDGNSDAPPGWNGLGATSHLIFTPPD